VVLALAACGGRGTSTGGAPAAPDAPATPSAPLAAGSAVCGSFVVTGDSRSRGGARWTYASTDAGTTFALEGVLFAPSGPGPFAAVVASHGKGGAAESYGAAVARVMVPWGLVVIAPQYTHASPPDGEFGLPLGPDGASGANVARAHKTRQVLSCLPYVDASRVAAHGYSMGAFVTGEVLGVYPDDFLVASHTAGGSTPVTTGAPTHAPTAERIRTPYQLHHGDADTVVALAADQDLSRILDRTGAPHELRVYPGLDHSAIAFDPSVMAAIHGWYAAHGLF
jgi:dienelactone hydrolase